MNIKAKSQKKTDIIISSKSIKDAILKRKEQLSLTYGSIVEEAEENGITGLTKSSLSLYFNNDHPVSGFPTQRHILYLCFRYGISVGLNVRLLNIKQEHIDGKLRKVARTFARQTERMG